MPGELDATGSPASDPSVQDAQRRLLGMRLAKEFSFENLPISEVVYLLKKEIPTVNFVIDPDIKNETVNIERFQNPTLGHVLTAIQISTKNKVSGRVMGDNFIAFQPGDRAGEHDKIYQAFGLSEYLEGKSDQEMTKALQDMEEVLMMGWSMLGKSGPKTDEPMPQLKLHQGTKLLVVVGTPRQVEMVQQVVDQLQKTSSPYQRSRYMPPSPPMGSPYIEQSPAPIRTIPQRAPKPAEAPKPSTKPNP